MGNEKNHKIFKEAAEKRYGNLFNAGKINAFIDGAEYQAEKMYSEDEVRLLLQTQKSNCYVAVLTKTKDEELAAIAGDAPEPGGFNGWVKKEIKHYKAESQALKLYTEDDLRKAYNAGEQSRYSRKGEALLKQEYFDALKNK